MKKSLISSHFAHHRPRDKLVTYYLYCYDLCQQEMYRQEHPVVGRVTFASGEQQEFTDSKALLQAIRENCPSAAQPASALKR